MRSLRKFAQAASNEAGFRPMLMLCPGKPPFKEIALGAGRVARVRAATTFEKAAATGWVIDLLEKHALAEGGDDALLRLVARYDDAEFVAGVKEAASRRLAAMCTVGWNALDRDGAPERPESEEQIRAFFDDPARSASYRSAMEESTLRYAGARPDHQEIDSLRNAAPEDAATMLLLGQEHAAVIIRRTAQAELEDIVGHASRRVGLLMHGDVETVRSIAELGHDLRLIEDHRYWVRAALNHLTLIDLGIRCIQSAVGLVDEGGVPIAALAKRHVAALVSDSEVARALGAAIGFHVVGFDRSSYGGAARPTQREN